MGLVIILALGLYFLISIGVVAWAVKYAKQQGKSAKLWGAGAALVMFLIPFWDWLPTVAAHKYYCETQAGFWVYKTPEQWKKENLGVMEGLVYEQLSSDYKIIAIEDGFSTTYSLNQRMKVLNKVTHAMPMLDVSRKEYTVLDSKTNDILLSRLSFEAGKTSGAPSKLSDFKFWINLEQCKGRVGNSTPKAWGNAENLYRNMGAEK